MLILITGGCGFIGTNVALKALSRGYSVVAFDNLCRKGSESNLEELSKNHNFVFIKGDVRNYDQLSRIKNVDAIIHTAAQPGVPASIEDPIYDFEVNALGTLNVLELAKNNGKIPVIYCSTNKVYSCEVNEIQSKIFDNKRKWIDKKFILGIPEGFPVDSGGRAAYSPYGCSKYIGDRYCQEYYHTYGVPTVVNRMSCIAGERQLGKEEQGWVSWFVYAKMVDAVINIYGDGKQVRDVLYVGDLADLFLKEIEDIDIHKGQVYNVGGGPNNTVSLIEVLEYLSNLDQRPYRVVYQNWRPADHLVYVSDIRKVSKYWQPKLNPKQVIDIIWDWAHKNRKRVCSIL
ncbi:MAG: nucleoside-diphosphate sugar epimerase [Candidatus Omnitrophota bacterium]|nr:MAG: nucleoside-diphosphate sugar epimerase [Candidatus Omnitrophota bacterium]